MSYVDTDSGSRTELRVHGMAATPPEAMMRHPHEQSVAGDSQPASTGGVGTESV